MAKNQIILFAALATIWSVASAQSPTATGTYTDAQATSGKQSYDEHCADCHLMTLRGSGHGPELAGPNFMSVWSGRTTAELFTYIKTRMPSAAPASLSDSAYIDIVAHILRTNGSAPGNKELLADSTLVIGKAVLGNHWDSTQTKKAEASTPQSGWRCRWRDFGPGWRGHVCWSAPGLRSCPGAGTPRGPRRPPSRTAGSAGPAGARGSAGRQRAPRR